MLPLELRLLEFVRDQLLEARGVPIDVETYLFDEGLIDSLQILRLIAFLEMETGRAIPDADVVMQNFRNVRTIATRFGTHQV